MTSGPAHAPTATETVRYALDDDGIVTLTLDDPLARVNTMNARYSRSMQDAVDRLYTERDRIAGVVVTSAKSSFFAGGDLSRMLAVTAEDAADVFAELQQVKADLRRLEQFDRPVAAAVNGSALGAGLEIALACHRRFATDDPRAEIGLPEVTLGLLPGAGGVTRTVRMLGLQEALTRVLLQGPRLRPEAALQAGLVDELVGAQGSRSLVETAKAWVLAHATDTTACTQPWDRDGYRMPGGTPSSPKLAQVLPSFPANLRKQLKAAPYPAPRAILAAAVEGAQVDFDTATRIESRYFVDLVTSDTAKNMIQAFFFDLQAINNGHSRPAADQPTYSAQRVGILGAGMMGAGIAYECARAGMQVALKDVSVEAAERAKSRSVGLLDRQVERGRLSAARRDETLARIRPTDQSADLAGCDLVIEAVFESQRLKQQVFREVQDVVAPDALLCSNTSTLPITGLAEGVDRRADFIGLHFFSPVERMPLVEIIVGADTSDAAVARAYDVVRQLKKTPIVVNDSRGFFTSRVFGTLVMEGAAMLAEGVDPVSIERAATSSGFPAPPLAMLDELSLTLAQKIRDEGVAAAASGGGVFDEHPGMAVVDRMVDEFGRRGKASGAGFYDYPEGGGKRLWPLLHEHFDTRPGSEISPARFRDLQDRFLFAMSLETVKCVAEGVLRSTAEANIGSIFGIGFPPLHGGALQFVNSYRGYGDERGPAAFTRRARELTGTYGVRFDVPALLDEMVASGRAF